MFVLISAFAAKGCGFFTVNSILRYNGGIDHTINHHLNIAAISVFYVFLQVRAVLISGFGFVPKGVKFFRQAIMLAIPMTISYNFVIGHFRDLMHSVLKNMMLAKEIS